MKAMNVEKPLQYLNELIDYISKMEEMAKTMGSQGALIMADTYRKVAFDYYKKGNKSGFKISEEIYKIFLKRAKSLSDIPSSQYSETLEELTK